MTNAESKATQRANAVRAGLCRECCYRKPKKGRKTCAECLQAAITRNKRNASKEPSK